MNYLDLLDAHRATHGRGVDTAAVQLAEDRLGGLSAAYQRFLLQVGWASIGAQEINGLGEDLVHRWQDVVLLTEQERHDGGLPNHLVAIHADGGGNFTCLDGEQVVLWTHDDGRVRSVSETFDRWLPTMLAVG